MVVLVGFVAGLIEGKVSKSKLHRGAKSDHSWVPLARSSGTWVESSGRFRGTVPAPFPWSLTKRLGSLSYGRHDLYSELTKIMNIVSSSWSLVIFRELNLGISSLTKMNGNHATQAGRYCALYLVSSGT